MVLDDSLKIDAATSTGSSWLEREIDRTFTLEDKFLKENGYVLLTGIQALVRLAMDQHRADKRKGLNTATLVSGYRGSPLGGLDITLESFRYLLDKHQIMFQPAVNEELGATAIFGSQTANLLPRPKYDGVLGMWYGKSPGVDRSTDSFKHANFAGVGRYGGVLAIAGDDPISKSSTLPSHSEMMLADAYMPVLYPGNAQDILDLGRLGFELSRYSGLWTGFKIVTNVADEFSTAVVDPGRLIIEDPGFEYNGKPWQHNQSTNLLTPYSLTMEREIYEGRLEAARRFAATNSINTITVLTGDAWLGIVAAGKTYFDLRQALDDMGLTDDMLQKSGIRLLKMGMLHPMEPDIIKDFARGLDEILVIEEKRGFMEMAIRDVLYGHSERPRVVGKRDEDGHQLVKPYGALTSDDIVQIVAARVRQRVELESIQTRLDVLRTPPSGGIIPVQTSRSPYYCSGCPHNTSTTTPEDALVGAGIGCHTMTLLMPDRPATGITQMGGEGVQWVGASPFTDTPHIFQNLGDGTLFHSATLAIRQSIAANANITYKILYNSAVAMTGGQVADGEMSVPNLVKALTAEGVQHIIITSNEPDKYAPGIQWPEGITIWHRDRIEEAQEKLSHIEGVTILIHDQECAAELRRKRKRGQAHEPATRVLINEAVCEGCGDCGEKSNCLSVQPVDTEFGRKTQIHQSSCNKDYSCLKGDCPAFVEVIPAEDAQPKLEPFDDSIDMPDPELRVSEDEYSIYMMGIGGTGVVTTNQVMATAAMIEGKHVRGLDQTGLSQKGGPVVSHLKLFSEYKDATNKVSAGGADLYLAFDLLSAVDPQNLDQARPKRTAAVVSTSETPTGQMVTDTSVTYPSERRLLDSITSATNPDTLTTLDAVRIAEALFGSHMPANLIVIGAAYQAGLLPISATAIEHAIHLNGVSVKKNIKAFRAGRYAVADPEWATNLGNKRAGDLDIQPELTPEAASLIDEVGAEGELLRLLQIRVPELIAYQNVKYAQEYVQFVKYVYEQESVQVSDTRLSEAVARYLYKLMAYKDEYEVARLHMKSEFHQVLADQFGNDAQYGYMLHPPLLRALGMKRKLKLGRWFEPFYRLLMRIKGLRGTPFDIFGYAHVRRVERRLPGQYRQLIEQALATDLNQQENYEAAVKLAELPDVIRGYEDIKLRNVDTFWQEVEALGYARPA